MPTAEQVLFVLNGCEPIDPASLWFCVITAPDRGGSWWPCQPGELLVVDDACRREPIGGRKIEKGIQEQAAAETARTRAYLDWAQTQRMILQYAPPRSSWLGVITGL